MAAAVFVDGASAATKAQKKKKKEKEKTEESAGLTKSSVGTSTLDTYSQPYGATLSLNGGVESGSVSFVGLPTFGVTGSTSGTSSAGSIVFSNAGTFSTTATYSVSGFTDGWIPILLTGPIDTVPDIAQPTGGTMVLSSGSKQVDRGENITVDFSGWTDASAPLSYEVLIDDVVVSAKGNTPSRSITAPNSKGEYTVKGRIYDSVGNMTEVVETLYVATKLPKKK